MLWKLDKYNIFLLYHVKWNLLKKHWMPQNQPQINDISKKTELIYLLIQVDTMQYRDDYMCTCNASAWIKHAASLVKVRNVTSPTPTIIFKLLYQWLLVSMYHKILINLSSVQKSKQSM